MPRLTAKKVEARLWKAYTTKRDNITSNALKTRDVGDVRTTREIVLAYKEYTDALARADIIGSPHGWIYRPRRKIIHL